MDTEGTFPLGEALMHTVELLDVALAAARRLGFCVREDWLGDAGGGTCEFGGQKWIFLDHGLDVAEQLAVVAGALSADPGIHQRVK